MSEKIISLNEGAIKRELGEFVRQSVEETQNAMLDAEADRLTNAGGYERTDGIVTWGSKLYLNMNHLEAQELEPAVLADPTAGRRPATGRESNVRKILDTTPK